MIKIIGAVIIITSTTGIGMLVSRRFSERPRQLRQLRSALQSLEAEIMYGLTPVREAASHLSTQLPKPLSLFFKQLEAKLSEEAVTLQSAWEETLESFWEQTALQKSEKEIMYQFGATLGKHDSENERKQIRLALAHLEREENEARQAQGKYEKMSKSLGLLAGLLIVLLLL
ncbi:stage III sporulation protein SpoIIIAB [Scopulibacillus cellulosilyticus]|uniref:Stage III sporulation protein SpoIIIAB n=1 Tax=Scopulibacillus cellulosilyticus TaxID=2665665 RepID=A0ABW2PYK9_9BACL